MSDGIKILQLFQNEGLKCVLYTLLNLFTLACIVVSIFIIIKLNALSPSKLESPVLPSGTGSWLQETVLECEQGFDELIETDYAYYCQGKGMLDGYSNDICPKGTLMALNKAMCSKPVIADEIAPLSNKNNYLCCKQKGSCGNLPVDSNCMGTVQCKSWNPPTDCTLVPDLCVDAPPELGLPKNVGYCKSGLTSDLKNVQTDPNSGNNWFVIEDRNSFLIGFLIGLFIVVSVSCVIKRS